jgi:hypothetical protein
MTDADQLSRETAEKLFAAWERWDLDTVGVLVADNAIDERPQSGERFVGRSNIMGMYAEVPGPPRIPWRSIVGGSSAWVAEGSSTMARDRSTSSALLSWRTAR